MKQTCFLHTHLQQFCWEHKIRQSFRDNFPTKLLSFYHLKQRNPLFPRTICSLSDEEEKEKKYSILSILCQEYIFRDTCLHAEYSLAVTFQGSEKQPIPCISHADGAVVGAHYQQLTCSFLSCSQTAHCSRAMAFKGINLLVVLLGEKKKMVFKN